MNSAAIEMTRTRNAARVRPGGGRGGGGGGREGGRREVVRFEEIDGRYTLIDPSLPFFLSFAIKLRRWMQVNINESYK